MDKPPRMIVLARKGKEIAKAHADACEEAPFWNDEFGKRSQSSGRPATTLAMQNPRRRACEIQGSGQQYHGQGERAACSPASSDADRQVERDGAVGELL